MDKKFTIWLTGLSASGKTTLAQALYQDLKIKNQKVHHLDGDEVRAASQDNFGFDKTGRDRNIKLAIELARKYQDQGFIVIASFISPYKHHRTWGRERLENYIELFVDTSLEVCESRDPKGLYKKARAGEIKLFTGIDDPYEAPEKPEIHIKTNELGIEESVKKVIDYLEGKYL